MPDEILIKYRAVSEGLDTLQTQLESVNKSAKESATVFKQSMGEQTAALKASKAEIASYATASIRSNEDQKKSIIAQKTEMMKLGAEVKTAINSDKEYLNIKAQQTRENQKAATAIKEQAAALKQQALVMKDLQAVEQKEADVLAKIAKGELDYAAGAKKLQDAAKATYMEREKLVMQAGSLSKMNEEQKKQYQELTKSMQTAVDKADEMVHANDRMKATLVDTPAKFIEGAKAVGQLSGSIAGMSGAFGEFGKIPGLIANQIGGLVDSFEKLESKGTPFQKAMAGANMALGAIMLLKGVWDSVNGMIDKSEKATIEKGKEATKEDFQLESYKTGNKTLEDRIKLTDELAKTNVDLASKLRGAVGDVSAFDKAMKEAQDSLRKVREEGASKEWEVSQSGGGLLGWLKSVNTNLKEVSESVGKTKVALEDARNAYAAGTKAWETGMSSFKNYAGGIKGSLKDIEIQIAEAEGRTADAQALKLKLIQDQGAEELKNLKTQKLINDSKLTEINLKHDSIELEYRLNVAKIESLKSQIRLEKAEAVRKYNLMSPGIDVKDYNELEKKGAYAVGTYTYSVNKLKTDLDYLTEAIKAQKTAYTEVEGEAKATAEQNKELEKSIRELPGLTNQLVNATQELWRVQKDAKDSTKDLKEELDNTIPTVTDLTQRQIIYNEHLKTFTAGAQAETIETLQMMKTHFEQTIPYLEQNGIDVKRLNDEYLILCNTLNDKLVDAYDNAHRAELAADEAAYQAYLARQKKINDNVETQKKKNKQYLEGQGWSGGSGATVNEELKKLKEDFDKNYADKPLVSYILPSPESIKKQIGTVAPLLDEAASDFADKWIAAEKDAQGKIFDYEQQKQAEKEKYKDLGDAALLKIDEKYAKLEGDVTKKANDDKLSALKAYQDKAQKLYEDEYKKLTKLEEDYGKRIAAREQSTGDARVEINKYVYRQKLNDGQKSVYDLANQLGDEYEKYRKAGLSEKDLDEWLALRKKELTKDTHTGLLSEFDKFFTERKQMAETAAAAEKAAWDAETKRQRDEITTQKGLVDALRKSAEDAKKILLDLLGLPTGQEIVDNSKTETKPIPGDYGSGGYWDNGVWKTGIPTQTTPAAKPEETDFTWDDQGRAFHHGHRSPSYDKKITTPAPIASEKPIIEAPPPYTQAEITAWNAAYEALKKISGETLEKLKTDADGIATEVNKIYKAITLNLTDSPGKDIVEGAAKTGKEAGRKINDAMRLWLDPAFAEEPNNIGKHARQWGLDSITNFAGGVADGASTLEAAVLKVIAQAIEPYLKHSIPKEGPLKNEINWGREMVSNIAMGITDAIPEVKEGIDLLTDSLKSSFAGLGQSITKGVKDGFGGSTLADMIFGVSVTPDTSEMQTVSGLRDYLLSGKGVKNNYDYRQNTWQQNESGFEALLKGIGISSNKDTINRQSAIFTKDSLSEAQKTDTFWQWYSKDLTPPDLGDVDMNHLKIMVRDNPAWKTSYALQKKLKEQYPELLDAAFAQGILTPVQAKEIKKGSKTIGWEQTGNVYSKTSMDSLSEYMGEDTKTFMEWLQGDKYNTFIKEKRGGSGLSDWVDGVEAFLDNYRPERLKQLVDEYRDYINKSKGALKDVDQQTKDLANNFASTDIGKALSQGASLDEALTKSAFGKILGKDWLDLVSDKQVLSGGSFYDKNGKAVNLGSLTDSYGGISGGAATVASQETGLATKTTTTINQLLKGGYSWMTLNGEQVAFSIISDEEFAKLKSQGVDITEYKPPSMSTKEYEELRKNHRIPIIITADYVKGLGYWKESGQLKGLVEALGQASGGGSHQGLNLVDLTWKDTYSTVKGDYKKGSQMLTSFFGDMSGSKKSQIMDAVVTKIDELWKDTSYNLLPMPGVEEQGVQTGGTQYVSKDTVRKSKKVQLAKLLGFSDEFIASRGWATTDNLDANTLADEELIKNIEMLDGVIKDMSSAQEVNGDSTFKSPATDFINELINSGQLNKDSLSGIQEAMRDALSTGAINESEAQAFTRQLLPQGVSVPSSIIGLPGYNPSEGLLTSPWGPYAPTYNNQYGQRNFLGGAWNTGARQGLQGYGSYQSDPYRYTPYMRQPSQPMLPLQPSQAPSVESSTFSGTGNNIYISITLPNASFEDGTDFSEKIIEVIKKSSRGSKVVLTK